MSDLVKKARPKIDGSCTIKETDFQYKDLHKSRVKAWKIFHANTNEKIVLVVVLVSDQLDF